jgi:alkylation response protein AidB-like acyl-CoA dehydrogenase
LLDAPISRAVRDGQAIRHRRVYDVADKALQLHGGYGYLREYGLEKIVHDLRVHRLLEGINEMVRVVIGRAEATWIRASA